jgi:hypothetical protein
MHYVTRRSHRIQKHKFNISCSGVLVVECIPGPPDHENSALLFGPDDVDINIGDTSTPTHNQISGPITQARARQLNNQISSFLASYSSYLDNGNMCSVLLLRNDGQEGKRVGFARATFGFQNSSTL